MPIYNAGNTLAQALQSLLRQRFEAFELIAVDDGSEDNTAALLKQAARSDARIRPLFPGRQGLIPALNTGLAQARGAFIARMDADDIAHPDRLGLQYDFLQTHPDIALVGSLIRCFPRSDVGEGFRVYEAWLNSLLTPREIAREIYIESPLTHPSVTIRREDLEAAGGYKDFGWAEDYDLWLRLHLAGRRFAKIPRVLLSWRESPNRLTRRDGRYSVENFLRAKAHYLRLGPLADDPRVIIWGAGQIGRRLSKHLQREGIDLTAFVDIDPKKIGNTRRGAPIISPGDLSGTWKSAEKPLILAAVPSRGARGLIRDHLNNMGLSEGTNYLCVA
jgi:glycosyltransferase involved in cell wall biosynthesis